MKKENIYYLENVYQIPQRAVCILIVDECDSDHSLNAQSFTNWVTQMCKKKKKAYLPASEEKVDYPKGKLEVGGGDGVWVSG